MKKLIQPFLSSLLKKKEVYFLTTAEGMSTEMGHFSTLFYSVMNVMNTTETHIQ